MYHIQIYLYSDKENHSVTIECNEDKMKIPSEFIYILNKQMFTYRHYD